MSQMIFVNLPVNDVKASRRFYTALGFQVNEKFSGDVSICVVISEYIYLMLLNHERYADFTPLPIGDAKAQSQHMLALSYDSQATVDRIMKSALDAGGGEPRPVQDLGFMYSRCFTDPDGHAWEPFWMDPAAAEQGPPAD